LAREIPHDLRATIFTTSAPVAIELASRPLIDLHVIGGRFEKAALETAGPAAVDALRAVRADVCLFSVWAIRPAEGLTVGHVDDAPTLQAMIAGAAEVVGLATADKLDTVQPFVVAPIEELTHLVTERSAEERLVSPYKRSGLTVVHG
jgi:DeoR/GlpR family transcriptional regulator of sugar metabolism